MKIRSMAGVVLAAGLVAGFAGCAARPVSVVDVDQSVLPATAKAILPQDAVVTSTQKETYRDGTEIFILHYTLDGVKKSIKVNGKDYTSPSGVFNISK